MIGISRPVIAAVALIMLGAVIGGSGAAQRDSWLGIAAGGLGVLCGVAGIVLLWWGSSGQGRASRRQR